MTHQAITDLAALAFAVVAFFTLAAVLMPSSRRDGAAALEARRRHPAQQGHDNRLAAIRSGHVHTGTMQPVRSEAVAVLHCARGLGHGHWQVPAFELQTAECPKCEAVRVQAAGQALAAARSLTAKAEVA